MPNNPTKYNQKERYRYECDELRNQLARLWLGELQETRVEPNGINGVIGVFTRAILRLYLNSDSIEEHTIFCNHVLNSTC